MIGAGTQQSFTVDQQGDVWAFCLGQLGIGYTTEETFPVLTLTWVSGPSVEALGRERVIQISGGEAHTPRQEIMSLHAGSAILDNSGYQRVIRYPPTCQVSLPDPDDHVIRIATSTRGNWVVIAAGVL